MSKFSPEKQREFAIQSIKKWMPIVEKGLQEEINKREKHIPSSVKDGGISQEITDRPGALVAYAIKFPDEGRFVDMKKLEIDLRAIAKSENFTQDWVRKRGSKKFRKGIPGYKKGKTRHLTEEQKIQRLAGAMIASAPRRKKRRRGRWYNRKMYSMLGDLLEIMHKDQAEFFQACLKSEWEAEITKPS